MGASFVTLQSYVSLALGTDDTRLFTTDARKRAINRAIREILAMYDVNNYINETTLTFSNGVASLPTDCMRPYLLIDSNKNEYERIDIEGFALQNSSYTYKMKYNTGSDIEQIQTYPASTQTLTFFYVQNPADLSSSGDTVRFNSYWDQAIAEKSAEILLMNYRRFDAAQAKQQIAKKLIDQAWQVDRLKLVGKENQRLTSTYERDGMFRGNGFVSSSYTSTEMTDQLAWVTIEDPTTSASGTNNTGYVTNNTVTRTEISLPSSGSVVGDLFQVQGQGAAGWKVTQTTSQRIIFGNQTTTTGTAGYIQSTHQNDAVMLVYIATNIWEVQSAVGNITLN